jgi:hypothetical protein
LQLPSNTGRQQQLKESAFSAIFRRDTRFLPAVHDDLPGSGAHLPLPTPALLHQNDFKHDPRKVIGAIELQTSERRDEQIAATASHPVYSSYLEAVGTPLGRE